MKSVDQKQFWLKVCQGDEKTFETLYDQYAIFLYQYGLKLTPKTELIEDCIQELFTRIFNNHKNLGETDNIKFYLIKSFRNNLIRMIERENKYSFENCNDYFFEVIFSAEERIVEVENENKKVMALTKALKKLSARQKEAIYLRYSNGLEYDEISKIMEISIEGSRNLIYRALKSLRKEIDNSNVILLMLFEKTHSAI